MTLIPDPDRTLDQAAVPIGNATLTVVPTTRTDLPPTAPAPQGYEILAAVGQGGMGIVYKAKQRSLNRTVALKVILGAAHATEAARIRFRAEATAVASLHHPNIVQVFETGEQDGQPFMALEYIEGGSLADLLRGEAQQPRVAAELVRTLAHAIQHAHERDVIHRDLKPANVLLTQKLSTPLDSTLGLAATLKITDFGLAKQSGETHLTVTGAILGTPSYMAPEQAAGQGTTVGPAADVYALGGILYETLVGRPPFRAPTPMDTILQVLHTDPVPPRQLQPTVPHDLETIALKCLAKKPEQRYVSAADLAADLERFLAGEPILARPVGRLTKAWKWAKRHPALAVTGFVFAVPLPILLGVMVLLFVNARSARIAAEQAQQAAEVARVDEAAALQKAEQEKAITQAYLDNTIVTVEKILDRVGDLRLARIPAFQEDREIILNDGVALFESLLRVDSTKPSVRLETARSQNRAGKLALMAGRGTTTAKLAQAALDLLNPLVTEFPETPEYRHERARALLLSASAAMLSLDYDVAIPLAQGCADDCTTLLAMNPKQASYHMTGSEVHRMLGMFLLGSGRAQAQVQLLKSVEHADAAYQIDRTSEEYRGSLAFALAVYGKFFVGSGNASAAEPILKRTEDILAIPENSSKITGTAREFLDHAAVNYRSARGELLLRTNPREAIPYLKKVAEDYEAAIKASPKAFPYRVHAIQTYLVLWFAYKSTKQREEMLQAGERGMLLCDQLLHDMPQLTWVNFLKQRFVLDLALYHLATGTPSKAFELAAIFTRASPKQDNVIAYNIGCLFAQLAEKAESTARDEFAIKALEWLRHAEKTGYPMTPVQVEHVKKDTDLDSLRMRPDFQAWLEQLKPAAKK